MPASFSTRYRFEDFINDLDAYMKANLAGYISQMNTDKTDITLLSPESTAYYFQTLADTEVPYKIFVFYGEKGIQTQHNGPEERNEYTIQVGLLLENGNELHGAMGKRLMRYRDCLKAMFNDGWNSMSKRVKLRVSGLSPFPFSLIKNEFTHIGIGVDLEVDFS